MAGSIRTVHSSCYARYPVPSPDGARWQLFPTACLMSFLERINVMGSFSGFSVGSLDLLCVKLVVITTSAVSSSRYSFAELKMIFPSAHANNLPASAVTPHVAMLLRQLLYQSPRFPFELSMRCDCFTLKCFGCAPSRTRKSQHYPSEKLRPSTG